MRMQTGKSSPIGCENIFVDPKLPDGLAIVGGGKQLAEVAVAAP